MFAINTDNLETLKYHIFFKKTLGLFIFHNNCGHECKKIFKEKESVQILKILGLITNIEEYQQLYNHVLKKSQEFRLKNIDTTRNYFKK